MARCGRMGCGGNPSATRAGGTVPKSEMVTGRWTPLPPHGGTSRVRGAEVAVGAAGAFLGLTLESDGPRVLFGRWKDDNLEWGGPWVVPLPPPKQHVEHWMTSWAAVGEGLGGLGLTIDRLDPMRIAV